MVLEPDVSTAMTRARSTSPAALLLLAAISCAGSKDALSPGTGTGGSNGIPPVACSNDSQCGSAGGCVAGVCVPKSTDLDAWAVEIDPPGASGSQLTELVSLAAALPVLTADAETQLDVPFANSANGSATVPATGSVILTVPSRIPGRPDQTFSANVLPGSTTVTLLVPAGIRSLDATVRLIPSSPADQATPPFTFPITIPPSVSPLATLQLPTTLLTIRGQLLDALGQGKGQFTARAFRSGILVSTTSSTSASSGNAAGSFILMLADGVGDLNVQLSPDGGAVDPWITLSSVAFTPPSTNLDTIVLPDYPVANSFRLAVHGGDLDQTPVSGAGVRAFTTLADGDARGSTKFVRDGSTDASGNALLSLIPGDTRPRSYSVSIIPPAGSVWASQCLASVTAPWNGPNAPAALLQDVTLIRRPTLAGTVLSANGAPVGNVVVTATNRSAPVDSCLSGPAATSTTTNAMGAFSLPLDPGTYQLEYDPPTGSSVPRQTEMDVQVTTDANRIVRLPTAALVAGQLQDAHNMALPNAAIRIFKPRCASTAGCTLPPQLLAETQSDATGHFRAVVAAGN
jgi:hypothetical protein